MRMLLCFVFLLSAGTVLGDDQEITLEKIREAWSRMDQSILSAEINFYGQRSLSDKLENTIDIKGIIDICRRLDSMASHKERSEYIFSLLGEGILEKYKEPIVLSRLVIEGKRYRSDMLVKGVLDYSMIYDGNHEIISDAGNKVVSVYHRRGSSHGTWRLQDFRFIPRFSDKVSLELFKNEDTVPIIKGFIQPSGRCAAVVKIDPVTLLPTEIEHYHHGILCGYTYHGDIKKYRNNEMVPSFVIDADFTSDEKLSHFKAVVIEKAVFNEVISDKEFEAFAPAGWRIFDCRHDQGSVIKVERDHPNAIQLLYEKNNMPLPEPVKSIVRSKTAQYINMILLGLNVLALFGLVTSKRRMTAAVKS